MTDPIVAEIRATRERIAEESGCDIHAIAEAARKRQQVSGVRTVSRPKRVPDANLAKLRLWIVGRCRHGRHVDFGYELEAASNQVPQVLP